MDTVELTSYATTELALKLGYSLFCRVDGIDTDLVVRDVRLVGERVNNGNDEVFVPAWVKDDDIASRLPAYATDNLEVRVLEGWRQPQRLWAVGPQASMIVENEQLQQQRGLFE